MAANRKSKQHLTSGSLKDPIIDDSKNFLTVDQVPSSAERDLNPGPVNPALRCWLRKATSPFGHNLSNSVCLASLGARILNTIKPHDFMLRQIKF